ncbi:MAG TPA: TolC family protein [Vicinamibacteria bacterium]|nr:TolC family protein [Vicinamibacteria bacterium]
MLSLLLTMPLVLSAQHEPSETPRQLTLREALALAFDRNLSLARARSDVPAADALRRLTRSAVLPHLSLNGSLIRNSTDVSFGPPDDVRTILPLVNWDLRFALSQPIFAGLRDLKAYRQSKIGIDLAREGVRLVSDEVLLTTSAQFLLALEAEALIEVERKNLELAESRRRQASELFEAGETTRVDVLRAEADIKAAERRVVEAERGRELAVSSLRRVLALDEDLELVEPSGDRRAVPLLPPAEELVTRALAARPEARRAEYALESAELEVEKQKGAYFPIVTADAGFVRQKTTFPRDTYGFGALRVSVPIYQGGEVGARVAIAEEQMRQAALALEEVQRAVREDIRIALFDVEASRTNLALAEEQLRTAEAEYAQTSELYRNQELTSLDLQVSEAALADARRAVATGRLLVYAAEIEVWYAAGSLSEVALQESTP